MAVLVLAEHDSGRLLASTARLVAAAEQIGETDVLIVSPESEALGAEAGRLGAVRSVLTATVATETENVVAVLTLLAERYTHIVAAASAAGRDTIPRLAAKLDIMPVTDVVEILASDRFVRPIYAGNALETVHSPQRRQLLTVRASAFAPAMQREEGAATEALTSPGSVTARTTLVAEQRTEAARPDLSTAQVVVAGGVSFRSAEKFALVEQLADALGAAVGATRAAVDAGYAPNDWQVGQTGKIVAPDLYIGIGISGALQHLAGIQGAKKIAAINTDPEAPLMKLADVALVGDLNEVVPALIAKLRRG